MANKYPPPMKTIDGENYFLLSVQYTKGKATAEVEEIKKKSDKTVRIIKFSREWGIYQKS